MPVKGNACSRPSVHQIIYQLAFFCKVAALIIFAFNHIDTAVYSIILWALLGVDLLLLGVVLLCQVCASIRWALRHVLKPKIVASILSVLVVFGFGGSIMLALEAFGHVRVGGDILKATFVFDVTSAILVLSLVFLNIFWTVDDLGKSRAMGDVELGVADISAVRRSKNQRSLRVRQSPGEQCSFSKRSVTQSYRPTKQVSEHQSSLKESSVRSRSARGSSARSNSVRTGRSRNRSSRH